MAISLYDLSVASFLQTMGGVAGFLQRGLDHCRDNNTDPSEIVETRLYGDMLPFRFQIVSVAHHSLARSRACNAASSRHRARRRRMTTPLYRSWWLTRATAC